MLQRTKFLLMCFELLTDTYCFCVTCSTTQIAYIECDPGQTEFTPPGCVSLHLVSEPVLGNLIVAH